MTRAVVDAFVTLDHAASALHFLGAAPVAVIDTRAAREALAAHIAAQDAEIASRYTRASVAELMRGMVPEIDTGSADDFIDRTRMNARNFAISETLARIQQWEKGA